MKPEDGGGKNPWFYQNKSKSDWCEFAWDKVCILLRMLLAASDKIQEHAGLYNKELYYLTELEVQR